MDAVEVEALAAALTAGDQRVAARLITRIECGDESLVPLLQALYRRGGRTQTIGVTGPPGAGKSTLVSRLVATWRTQGRRVAVLAVDPSSPFSGGAVLGDRVRMAEHACDDGVFIRSMASRTHLGGLARAAGDALVVLEAMPWDVVLVETVGVGQNETDVVRHAPVVVLVQTPMGGDDVQAAKAGITEIGDVFVVNKADHPQADATVRQLLDMIALALRLHPERQWQPPVLKTQALLGEGIAELAAAIDRCFAHFASHPSDAERRSGARLRYRVGEVLRELLERRLRASGDPGIEPMLPALQRRESDPYTVASQLLERIG
ncbi:MAG: methylmalonyl Co-A mutase-associated GTPase MeaB [Burkholderiaceae bacterium]|nr:MAG: methylmalonyl Co-A mutase-associated GTPase MeaB [Burkholderiaceae bacterium]MBE7426584.1 methylmalonyl Co-A mutase-associated GTPase MeaB [Ideonella sp.]MCC7286982.1 methylmalonyl Co-A mutase-associated GTPase MeaB [Burkholderiaceae bacterium]